MQERIKLIELRYEMRANFKRRKREISFEKLERIKDEMGFSWEEVESFLGIGTRQRMNYQATYSVPVDRYYAFKDALLIETEARHRAEREQIIKLFG